MSDRKYLKLRHNVWYFQKRVPKVLRELYHHTTLIEEPLGTGDIRIARQRRDIRLGQLQQQEMKYREKTSPKQRFIGYVEQLNQAAKEVLTASVDDDLCWTDVLDPETVNKTHDTEYIEAFRVVSQGETTSDKYGTTLKETLQHFVRNSEREGTHTEGTRDRYQKTVKLFLEYLNTEDIQLKDIKRSEVFNYIDHHLARKSGATVYSDISRLKTLWLHAYSRAWIIGDNPFDKHKINTTRGREKKQPFTRDELKNVLKAIREETLSMQLLTLMGLYTGARISELVKIRLQDRRDDEGILMMGIAIQDKGKTSAATRWIPVPSQCQPHMEKVIVNTNSNRPLFTGLRCPVFNNSSFAGCHRFDFIESQFSSLVDWFFKRPAFRFSLSL